MYKIHVPYIYSVGIKTGRKCGFYHHELLCQSFNCYVSILFLQLKDGFELQKIYKIKYFYAHKSIFFKILSALCLLRTK